MQPEIDRDSSDSDANSDANTEGMDLPDAGKIG